MRSRGNPFGRVLGSILGWMLIAGGATLVFRAAADLSLIGSCADGGPYVIAQHCPTTTFTMLPIGIVAVGLSLLVASLLSRGFGPSPFAGALLVLFAGSAITVVITVILNPYALLDLIIAALLILFTVALLRTRLKNRRGRQYFLGDATLSGEPFPWADQTIGLVGEPHDPTPRDWGLSLGTGGIGIVIGLALALPWALS